MSVARQTLVLAGAALIACASTQKPSAPKDAAAHDIASQLISRGEYQAAFDVIQPVCLRDPSNADALTLRGIIYTEEKLIDEAVADLEQALRIAPTLARAHSALAIVQDIRANSDVALEHHRRAVELAPGNASYLNNLGFSLFAAGRAREGIPYFQEALRAAPGDRKVRNNLGFAYASTGDFARGAEQFDLAGSRADARTNLAWSYERRGALRQAYDAYADAFKADPSSPTARENLARVGRKLGIDPGAIDAISPRS